MERDMWPVPQRSSSVYDYYFNFLCPVRRDSLFDLTQLMYFFLSLGWGYLWSSGTRIGDAPGEMESLPYIQVPSIPALNGGTCPPGWYSATGLKPCTVCPAGFMCPERNMTSPFACPQNATGVLNVSLLPRSTACYPCPAGMMCATPGAWPELCPNHLGLGT